MRYSDPKPEILRIEELVQKVKTGDIKLPKFQRPFVWNKQDIIKLLDSVYRGYPIGSVLLWLTKEKLASERRIGDLDINERPDAYPTNYILDGQQRLSTLCGVLFWKGDNKKSIWNIAFDLENEEFFYPTESDEFKPNYFPLNKLIETRDYINQCSAFESHPRKEKLFENSTRLLNSIKDYKIAAVMIGDMTLSEVAPIFERINSSGRQLTMVDLMRAATWRGGFDLNDAIENVRKGCESKFFYDIDEGHILRSIAAACDLGINKEDIDKLRDKSSSELLTASKESENAYKLAVDFLTTELPLTSISYLPYSLQLTYIVEFFNRCKSPSVSQRKDLVRWFWKTSFSRHYALGNSALISKDLKSIRSFATNESSSPDLEKAILPDTITNDTFVLNKASSLTFSLILAHKKPRSLLDGTRIDLAKALAITNRLEFHHIFPKAFLERTGESKERINSHLNICMLNLSSNREISDLPPSEYFPAAIERLGEHAHEVFLSNYIDSEALSCALRNDYDGFRNARKALIHAEMNSLIK